MTMTEPEKVLKKESLNQTIIDCKLQDNLYKQLDYLISELDDHRLNGRWSDYDKIINKIMDINKEITDTENRCRSRIGLKKL